MSPSTRWERKGFGVVASINQLFTIVHLARFSHISHFTVWLGCQCTARTTCLPIKLVVLLSPKAPRLSTAYSSAQRHTVCTATHKRSSQRLGVPVNPSLSCRDNQLDRRMTLLWESNSSMSLDLCAHIAYSEEWSFWALQWGRECWGGE